MRLIGLAFLTVLVAELGDKTQLSTFMLSAQSSEPWVVFLGAGSALLLTTLLGVLAGTWLAQYATPKLLETLTGISYLLLAVGLLWDAVSY
ncbi:MAG: TMEM165/GDT1 family protein [Pseudanabaenaceae cyanobacterium SKYGB_i_bin29]|nr:TMEM165/GDT1 family protein [Pseudanabaenaceae cyanobacterium SKYG29]MDW8421859.1 TMEM165/GDT1 family protein [Pseudanabaenaceae cyanobacterium SKYGB_i_bin29]